ncbi:hypothetical protein [Arcanobacterium phocae]|uniref:hypothetical protein n=1 Tax=Arcanobacterium phocae TaxID=131112 RepID=UPI001C0ED67B|nr:hypothetical protein [Arcanobacterium phocae]
MTTTEPTQPREELRALLPDNLDEYNYNADTRCPDGHAHNVCWLKYFGLIVLGYVAHASSNGGELCPVDITIDNGESLDGDYLIKHAEDVSQAAMFLKTTTVITAGGLA